MTACVESDCGEYRKQFGDGPARGIFQMEPATHDDIWNNYLIYRDDLANVIITLADDETTSERLEMDDTYACAMARIHYLRVKEPLPVFHDVEALAKYWKKYYNTELGKGKSSHAVEKYNEYRRFI